MSNFDAEFQAKRSRDKPGSILEIIYSLIAALNRPGSSERQ
jgi:hypothetical protein